jgi:tetratricopeptide (TPR) repeat protein
MGGVGKTQLAAAFARSAIRDGHVDLVLWINAVSAEAISTAYVEAAVQTGVSADRTRAAATRFLSWLETTKRRWAIVFDNLSEPSALRGQWPPDRGSVIVTTRRRDSALRTSGRAVVTVPVFDSKEAGVYVSRKLARGAGSDSGAAELIEVLGRHPLALAQVTAYMLDRDLSCSGYLERFHDRHGQVSEMLPADWALPDDHAATIVTTWSLSIEDANNAGSQVAAKSVLEFASVLSAGGAPLSMFRAAPAIEFFGADVTALQAEEGLRHLHRLSLVTVDDALVYTHELLQRVVRDNTDAGRIQQAVRSAADSLNANWIERDGLVQAAILRANARSLINHHDTGLWTPTPHEIVVKIGNSFGDVGQMDQAIEYFRTVVEHCEAALGPTHAGTIAARHHELMWLGKSGASDAARDALQVLAVDAAKCLGDAHALTIEIRADHAFFAGESGDHTGAIAALRRLAADIQGRADLHVTVPLNIEHNIAYFYGRAGEHAQASETFWRMLPIATSRLGATHLDTLKIWANAAGWTGLAGDIDRALAEFKAMLLVFDRALGPDHSDTIRIRFHIANLSRHDHPQQALSELEAVLRASDGLLGPGHPHTIEVRATYGQHLLDTGQEAAGREMLRFALKEASETFGARHPRTTAIEAALTHTADEQDG